MLILSVIIISVIIVGANVAVFLLDFRIFSSLKEWLWTESDSFIKGSEIEC